MRRGSRDPAVVLVAVLTVVAGARTARPGAVGHVERRVFRALNDLDERAFVPAGALMQIGSLGGALATGATLSAAGHRRLGRRTVLVAVLAWLGCKLVKPLAGRGRPSAEVDAVRVLGRNQVGLGYPSGHAAVAAAMASAAAPHVPRAARPLLWLVALGIGATRVYVGAHLPLDVVGGLAVGVGAERGIRAPALLGGRR